MAQDTQTNAAVREADYPRSPRVLLGGMAHLARLIDKIRLRHAGKILDYHYLTTGFDKALIEFLQIDAAAFEQRVLAGDTDEALLDWTRVHGRPLRPAEIRLWTRNILSSKPEDDGAKGRYAARLQEIAAKYGVPVESLPTITTWAEGIDLDEGRIPLQPAT
ncbi:MAG: DUF5069 domain-containing protein [Nitrospiraceae bacterium]